LFNWFFFIGARCKGDGKASPSAAFSSEAVVFLGVFIGFSSSFSLSFFAAKRIPLEEEKWDRKSIVFLTISVSSSPRKKKAALSARFSKNGNTTGGGRPPVRLRSESKAEEVLACIFRSRERRLCEVFHTKTQQRKKENNTTNTRNGDDIYYSL
tara:strand:- start:95 stop:556 length:462 start_codon:yes stop_codon:yes gene_type:complete